MEPDFDDEHAPVFGENPFSSSNRRVSIPSSEPASPTARNLSIFTDDEYLPSVGAGSSRPSVSASPFFTIPPTNQLTSNSSEQSLQDHGRNFSIPDYNQGRKTSCVSELSGTRSPMTKEKEQDTCPPECDRPHSPFTMHEDFTSSETTQNTMKPLNSTFVTPDVKPPTRLISHPRLSMLQKQASGVDRRSSSVYSRFQDEILDMYITMSSSSPDSDSQSTSPGERASWLTSNSVEGLLRPDVYETPPPVPAIPAPYVREAPAKKGMKEPAKFEGLKSTPSTQQAQESSSNPSSSDTSPVTRQLMKNISANINHVFDYELLPEGPASPDELSSPVDRAFRNDHQAPSAALNSKTEPIPSPQLSSSASSFRHQRNFSRPTINLGGKQSTSPAGGPSHTSDSQTPSQRKTTDTDVKDHNKAQVEPPKQFFRPQLDSIPSEEEQNHRKSPQQVQRAESRSPSDSTGRHSTTFQMGSTFDANSTVPSTEPSPTQETHPVPDSKETKTENIDQSVVSNVEDGTRRHSSSLFPPARPARPNNTPPARQNFDFNKAVSYVKDHLPDLPDAPSGLVSQHFVEKRKESWISRRLKNIDRLMLKSTEYRGPPPKPVQDYSPVQPQATRPKIVHIPDRRIVDERTKLGPLVDLAPQQTYFERKKSSPSLLRRLSQKFRSSRSSKYSQQGYLISPSVYGSQASPYGTLFEHEHPHNGPIARYSTYRSEVQRPYIDDGNHVRVPREDFYRQHTHTRSNDTGVLLRNGRADAYPRQVAFARPVSTYSGSQPFTPIDAGNPYARSFQEPAAHQSRFSVDTVDSYDRYGPARPASSGPQIHQTHIAAPRAETYARISRIYTGPSRYYDAGYQDRVVEYGNPDPDPAYGGAYAAYDQPRVVYVRPESQVFRREPSLRRPVYDDGPRTPRYGWEETDRRQQRWV